jgi:hypothetical protein
MNRVRILLGVAVLAVDLSACGGNERAEEGSLSR